MNYYPALLNLLNKKAVVVGGGKIAERKILALIKTGAAVTVISPAITPRLKDEKEKNRISHVSRRYRRGDLLGCFIVIAATDDPSVNTQIASDAPGLVNVVDVPRECSFIAPSVVRRGPLTIAVSTSGTSPALSKTIRKEIEKIYGPEIGRYLNFTKKMRKAAFAKINDTKIRERFLKGIASEKILNDLRSKGYTTVRSLVERKFRKCLNSSGC